MTYLLTYLLTYLITDSLKARDASASKKMNVNSTSGSTDSLFTVVDENSDNALCQQGGVRRCREVVLRKKLKDLEPWDTMDLVTGEGIRMALLPSSHPRLPSTRSNPIYVESFEFSLDDGGDGYIDEVDNDSIFGLIRPKTRSTQYAITTSLSGSIVLMEHGLNISLPFFI